MSSFGEYKSKEYFGTRGYVRLDGVWKCGQI